MDMIDPTYADAGLFLVIIATAIATILTGFLIVACIARFGFKIKVSVSSFITAAVFSVLLFIGVGALGPNESTSSLTVVQVFSLVLFIGTILINIFLLKCLRPRSIEELVLAEHKKSNSDCKEHYKIILNELHEIDKSKIAHGQNTPNIFKRIFKK